jgi:hypothetical protein
MLRPEPRAFVLDVLPDARAAQEVVLDASQRLLGGAEDQRALALHAPQQGVAHLVGELGVRELGVLGQERLEVERLPRAQQRVPVVEEELQQNAHAPGPLHASRRRRRPARAAPGAGAWSTRRSAAPGRWAARSVPLVLDERADEIGVHLLAATLGAAEARRPPQEEQRAELALQHFGERLLLGDLAAQAQTALALPERLEDPQAQIVHEPHQREPEALHEEVEAEEVQQARASALRRRRRPCAPRRGLPRSSARRPGYG